jgi:methyl-accepting chemotaxis protein
VPAVSPRFLRRGLRARLVTFLAAVAAVAAGSFALLTAETRRTAADYDRLLAGEVREREDARVLQLAFKTQVQEWKNVLLRGADPAQLAKHRDAFAAASRDVRARGTSLRDAATDPRVRALAARFVDAHAALDSSYRRAMVDFAAGGGRDVRAADRGVRRPRPAARRPARQRRRALDARVAARVRGNRAASERRLLALEAGGMVVLAGAALFAALLLQSITGPLRAIAAAARGVAAGDLDVRVDHDSADELGEVAASLRALVAYMQDVGAAAHQLGRGDLAAVALVPRSERDVTSRALTDAVGEVRTLIAAVDGLLAAAVAGRLAERADPARFHGAYAELVRGVNATLDAAATPVRATAAVLARVAERDLSVRVGARFAGEHAAAQRALDGALDTLADTLGEARTAAADVAAASAAIADGAADLARGAADQAGHLATIAGTVTDLGATAARSATDAADARLLADGAARRAGRRRGGHGGAARGHRREPRRRARDGRRAPHHRPDRVPDQPAGAQRRRRGRARRATPGAASPSSPRRCAPWRCGRQRRRARSTRCSPAAWPVWTPGPRSPRGWPPGSARSTPRCDAWAPCSTPWRREARVSTRACGRSGPRSSSSTRSAPDRRDERGECRGGRRALGTGAAPAHRDAALPARGPVGRCRPDGGARPAPRARRRRGVTRGAR